MNFKNKIILTFFVLLGFILFFNISNVFAFTFTCNNGSSTETIELPDVAEEYQSYFDLPYIISNQDGYIIRFLADDDSFFYLDGDLVGWSGTIHQFKFNGSSWNYKFNNNNIFGRTSILNHIYLNATIYSDGNKTDVFFQRPPQKVEGITIPTLETAQQIPQAIVTTLKILIPVGLVLLSIGLVVYLIKRVRYSIM